MLTTLGMILLGFAGFSAAFILFVFLFGDKGIFLNVTSSAAASTPITTFPLASASIPAGFCTGNIDLELTTLGHLFITGGMFATLILAIMMFMSPWSILNKCRVCQMCACPEPACPATCGGCAVA